MRSIVLSLFAGFVITLCSCNNSSTAKVEENVPDTVKPAPADNSNTALDWEGTYKGVLPCADCDGIETTITLKRDLGFTLTSNYLGKKDSKPFEQSGTFTWNSGGNSITLANQPANTVNQYLVGENQLIQLDLSGQRITGGLAEKYVLLKQ